MLIGTTRPETMLGDTAVAVHPEPQARAGETPARTARSKLGKANDKEAKRAPRASWSACRSARRGDAAAAGKAGRDGRRGHVLELPLVGRKIPLIADATPTRPRAPAP